MARSLAPLLLLGALAACTARLPEGAAYDSGVVVADADLSGIRPPDAAPRDADTVDSGVPRTPTWVDDVQPILARYCLSCHGATPVGGAPMALDTYARVTARWRSARSGQEEPVYVSIGRTVTATGALMPPGPTSPLTAEELDTIAAWVAAGAPERAAPAPDAGPDGGDAGVDATTPDAAPDAGPPDAGTPDAGLVSPLMGVGAVEVVVDGFRFIEGPLWVPAEGVLLFSDITGNRIQRLRPPNTVDVFRDPSAAANGLALDPMGRLITAEHEAHAITRGPAAGGPRTTLVADYRGQALSSPNDVTVRSDGVIYFTDPPYGLGARPREVPFNGLYRLVETATGTSLTVEWAGGVDTRPNGVVLSQDERTLFMADTAAATIYRFDVDLVSGRLSNRRVFVTTPAEPDGMAIDAIGNHFVATSRGIQAYAPDGTPWGVIAVPLTPSNIAWGDADRRTLYITAVNTVYRVRLVTPGVRD
jgi:gluconolactonase